MSIDNQINPRPEETALLGILDHPQALKNFELLHSRFGDQYLTGLSRSLLAMLSRTADPDMALNNFERFVSACENPENLCFDLQKKPELLRSILTIFGASRFLSTFLISDPAQTLALLGSPYFLSASRESADRARELDSLLSGLQQEGDFFAGLRTFRKREMLRIGLRDLLGKADLQETVSDLSELAELSLGKAYSRAEGLLRERYGRPLIPREDGSFKPAGFAVIAMGKLGGGELNFSSDVDLMYVYTADGETEGVPPEIPSASSRIANHQYFVKMAEKLSAAIGEKTADGFVFRVDLRLRPEGQRGPLAQSLGGYEIYYESWGQTWERSALIKARPVAGDPEVGGEFLERITPFVYRKYLDYSAIAEIRDMKQKINKDVEQKGRTHRDVKLGYGGIREIEFIIQAIQLMYAGRDKNLREKNSMRALHMLAQKGLISYQERAELSGAYEFLRMVEHRIQIHDDLQTQTMPEASRELRALARRAGYLDPGKEAQCLLRDYAAHTGNVRRIYDNLFWFTGEEADPSASHECDLLLDPGTTEREAVAYLGKNGFLNPEKAYRNLVMLREGAAFVHQTPRSRKSFHDVFPSIFTEMIASPNPDLALNHLESFLAAQSSWESFQSLVKLNPAVINMLIAVFANSEYLSRMLISRPLLVQSLLESSKSHTLSAAYAYARELADAMEKEPDINGKLDALRRFKHQEEIRTGMADLMMGSPQAVVSRELTRVAEVCVDAALRLAALETGKRFGAQAGLDGLAVIAVGKFGSRELTYASDLDILFVYAEDAAAPPPPGLTAFEYFSKISEKTISYLSSLTREGAAFRIDTRLRPGGSKGTLAQSIDSIAGYYSSHAQTWERQALLRARTAAGDRKTGRLFCDAIQSLIYQSVDRPVLSADIRSMRKRMEEEVGKEKWGAFNMKQGEGGMVDIEFIVQYLQLQHGKEHKSIRVPGIANTLRALRKKGLLQPDDAVKLRAAYSYLRFLESRMRIVTNQATNELSRDPAQVRLLARRMGYFDDDRKSAGQRLIDDFLKVTISVRSLFDRITSEA